MKEFNKYQLQEELKKALHSRNQENSKYFFYQDFVTIEYNDQCEWLYADWKGYQTEYSVKEGCEKMLEASKLFNCSKILNDNTNTVGIWTPAFKWMGTNWLPSMAEAGVKFFALVYSSSDMSRLSAGGVVGATGSSNIVQTFENLESAETWLNEQK
ncbi:MAG: hypothetical protein H7122_17500 [Chitinophagaceae bacterium]|nr:hypothetical protein [Chitinophagaceae bacterium]